MTRIGVVIRPDLPPEEMVLAAQAADRAGVDEIWLWEDCFYSGGIAAAATILARTDRVNVAIGVMPTPLRNIALTSMEVATLARLHPGRLRVGVGHGVQKWMEQVGSRVASPMTLLREQLSAMRSLLAGATVDVHGRYVQLAGVALDWPPTQPPPIMVGATGPKTLALSGELSDGTIIAAGAGPDRVRAALTHIAPVRDHEVVVYIVCATGEDAVRRATDDAIREGSDNPDDVIAAGDADQIATSLRRWVDVGATTVVLQPGPGDRDLESYFRLAATELPSLIAR